MRDKSQIYSVAYSDIVMFSQVQKSLHVFIGYNNVQMLNIEHALG
jgi:hypothetical protein